MVFVVVKVPLGSSPAVKKTVCVRASLRGGSEKLIDQQQHGRHQPALVG